MNYPAMDEWPEKYSQWPDLLVAKILIEQPDPPRKVTYWEMLLAVARSKVGIGVLIGGIIVALIILTGVLDKASGKSNIKFYIVATVVLLVVITFYGAWTKFRALRIGVRTEGELWEKRPSRRQNIGIIHYFLNGTHYERETSIIRGTWLDDVPRHQALEVLCDPKNGDLLLVVRPRSDNTN